MVNTQRYLDGRQWTDQVAPRKRPLREVGRFGRNDGLANWGWALAFLLWPVAIPISIVLMGRRDERGLQILLTALAVGVISILVWSLVF